NRLPAGTLPGTQTLPPITEPRPTVTLDCDLHIRDGLYWTMACANSTATTRGAPGEDRNNHQTQVAPGLPRSLLELEERSRIDTRRPRGGSTRSGAGAQP